MGPQRDPIYALGFYVLQSPHSKRQPLFLQRSDFVHVAELGNRATGLHFPGPTIIPAYQPV